MSKQVRISRRTMLQGLGTALALPLLEAMLPAGSLALADTKKVAPKRMAFFYVPNGVHMQAWTPGATGAAFELPAILEPLKPFQKNVLVLSGLTLDKARANGDGPGDHARAMSAFLTGRQPRKTSGADIRAGISVDQLAAEKLGKTTKFASLELGLDKGMNSGNCDSGYSCAYSNNLSWKGDALPMAKEVNPRSVFERLFSNQVQEQVETSRAKRERYQLSVLDFIAEDANQLRNRLGSSDQKKLDEYLTAVREIEVRLAKAIPPAEINGVKASRPTGTPADYQEHIRLLTDMLVLAFQADLTRISTFVYANDGSNRSYRTLGVPEGHHDLSHHGGNKEKQEKILKINKFHLSQFAYFVERLSAVKEGQGTLLDQCILTYGSGIGDGNRHNHDDLPIVVVGKGGGSLQTGRHIRYKRETPLTNLYLALLDRVGVREKSFGDSTGLLEELS